jgi:hypothetical protein
MEATGNQSMLNQQTQAQLTNPNFIFEFEILEQQLIIKAQSEKILYVCTRNPDPYMAFDLIKDLLLNKNFKIDHMNEDSLKILIGGFYPLEFKSQELLILNKFRDDINDIKNELSCQKLKNLELEEIIKSQETVIKTH